MIKLTMKLACYVTVVAFPGSVLGSIVDTADDVQLVPAPPSVLLGDYESNTKIRAFDEVQDIVLPVDIDVNASQPGTYTSNEDLTPATIHSGTLVRSHYLHLDPVGSTYVTLEGTATFDADILGVIMKDNELDNSHGVLGSPGTLYPQGFGLEFSGDQFTISGNLRRITVACTAGVGIDNVRVVTTIPEPATLSLLALGALTMMRRRRC